MTGLGLVAAYPTLETLTFEDQGGSRTLMRTNAVYQSVEDGDGRLQSGMEEGVNESMERLDELVARLAPVSGRPAGPPISRCPSTITTRVAENSYRVSANSVTEVRAEVSRG